MGEIELNGVGIEDTREIFKAARPSSWLIQKLNADRYSPQSTCDVNLCADDVKVSAHKNILSCYSDYFKKMFAIEMKEKYQKDIKIGGVKGTALQEIIDYIYTEQIVLSKDNVYDVLIAAHYLELLDVFRYCSSYLNNNFSVTNCLKVVKLGLNYNLDTLVTKAINLILRHLIPFTDGHFELVALDKDVLEKVLTINITEKLFSEEMVFEIITTWVNGDTNGRKDMLPHLFTFVDLTSLPLEVLQKLISTNQLVQDSKECMSIVMGAVIEIASKLKEILSEPDNSKSKCLLIGGVSKPNCSMVFNPNVKNWKGLHMTNICSYFSTATVCDDHVFIIGGMSTDRDILGDVEKMNLKIPQSDWEDMPSMITARVHAESVLYKGKICVIGGMDCVHNTLSCCEIFDPVLNVWTGFKSKLNVARKWLGLCNLKGKLYAIGGNNGKKELFSVERYSETFGCWHFVSFLNYPRSEFAAVVLGEHIYSIGGWDGKTTLNTVEKYDLATNKWINIAPMQFARQRHCACVMGGKLYVIGGCLLESSGEMTAVNTIEVYEEASDQWICFHEMVLPKVGASIIPY